MAATRERPAWMVGVDEELLEEFAACGRDTVTLVASRRGIHLKFAERRCRELERRGFLERSTEVVAYHITRRGARFVDDGSG